MASRYAIYYAPPPGSALDALGRDWLGRDAATGKIAPQPLVPGFSAERIAALTDDPRRYGFHGTLKPPFALADGTTEADLLAAFDLFARRRPPLDLPALRFQEIGRFLALVPGETSPALNDLARDAVEFFDRFRRPAGSDELARRRKSGLTPRQDAYLERWGYPYVMAEFRFHLTLTGSIADAGERALLHRHLSRATAHLTRDPFAIDAVCLFVQPGDGQPFRIKTRALLTGP